MMASDSTRSLSSPTTDSHSYGSLHRPLSAPMSTLIYSIPSPKRQSHHTMKNWIHSNHLHTRDNLVIRYALGVKAEPCQHADHMVHEDFYQILTKETICGICHEGRRGIPRLVSTSASGACGTCEKVAEFTEQSLTMCGFTWCQCP